MYESKSEEIKSRTVAKVVKQQICSANKQRFSWPSALEWPGWKTPNLGSVQLALASGEVITQGMQQ